MMKRERSDTPPASTPAAKRGRDKRVATHGEVKEEDTSDLTDDCSTATTKEDIRALIAAAESAAAAAAKASVAADVAAKAAAQAAAAAEKATKKSSPSTQHSAKPQIPEPPSVPGPSTIPIAAPTERKAPRNLPPALMRLRSLLSPPCGRIDHPFTIRFTESGVSNVIASPFTSRDTSKLSRAAKPSWHTVNGRPVFDKKQRSSSEISPSELFVTPNLATVILPTLNSAFNAPLSASLLKLNIYEPGDHFGWHHDRKRGDHHIGTLVVCLPSLFTGGNLRVQPGHRNSGAMGFVHDWSKLSTEDDVAWAFIPLGMEHTVLPVTAGLRMTLQYQIDSPSTTIDFGTTVLGLPLYREVLPSGGCLLIPLLSKYTETNVSSDYPRLEGLDATLLATAKVSRFSQWQIVELGSDYLERGGLWITERPQLTPKKLSPVVKSRGQLRQEPASEDPQHMVLALHLHSWEQRNDPSNWFYQQPMGLRQLLGD